MTYTDLIECLLEELRSRVRSGEVTERALAQLAGLSQPHLHHVLKGKRHLSLAKADAILSNPALNALGPYPESRRSGGQTTNKIMYYQAAGPVVLRDCDDSRAPTQFGHRPRGQAQRAIRAGAVYANVHTPNFPGGEIRGQLTPNARD